MLYNVAGQEINSIPHKKDYDRWISRLTAEQIDAVISAIHLYMNDKDIFNSSHIPGKDWTYTPFQVLYEACNQDQDLAAKFFGLICWVAVQTHEIDWICYKDKESNIGSGWTYFRKRI